jgi:uncharacterized protein YndB with AHSA1/START domain
MNSPTITVRTIINKEADKVWDYYTGPLHIVHWNFADPSWHCPTAENDMRIGGIYNARMEAKNGSMGFDFKAIYTEISVGKSFTYGFGGREASVQFNDLDGQTEVVVTFDPEQENPLEMQREGWKAMLNNFKEYAERN